MLVKMRALSLFLTTCDLLLRLRSYNCDAGNTAVLHGASWRQPRLR